MTWTTKASCVALQVTDLELDKGLLHLVNRGLLPQQADLTPALCGNTGAPAAGRPGGQLLGLSRA